MRLPGRVRMREGLMDDTGYHGLDEECPEEPNEENCERCIYWKEEGCLFEKNDR